MIHVCLSLPTGRGFPCESSNIFSHWDIVSIFEVHLIKWCICQNIYAYVRNCTHCYEELAVNTLEVKKNSGRETVIRFLLTALLYRLRLAWLRILLSPTLNNWLCILINYVHLFVFNKLWQKKGCSWKYFSWLISTLEFWCQQGLHLKAYSARGEQRGPLSTLCTTDLHHKPFILFIATIYK